MISRREFLRGKFSAPPEPARVTAPSSRALALIGRNCIAFDNTACRSCGDVCGADAIRFSPRFGAVEEPEIIADRCTGCGDCVPVCPARTITLINLQNG